MDISVIIPNYNNGRYIAEAIESVMQQSYRPKECIIVNDGSTDDSIQEIVKLQERYYTENILLVDLENGGVSKARNKGSEIAKYAWIAYLDADDYWQKDHLLHLVKRQAETSAEVIYSKYNWFNESGIYENDKIPVSPISLYDTWFDTYMSPGTICIKRSLLKKIGGWDENLSGCEDMDLWFRLMLSEANIACSDHFDVMIRQHGTNTKGNWIKMYQNHLISLKKWVNLVRKRDKLSPEQFDAAVIKKISIMRYYAVKLKSARKVAYTFILGFKILKNRYLKKIVIYQLYTSIRALMFSKSGI